MLNDNQSICKMLLLANIVRCIMLMNQPENWQPVAGIQAFSHNFFGTPENFIAKEAYLILTMSLSLMLNAYYFYKAKNDEPRRDVPPARTPKMTQ